MIALAESTEISAPCPTKEEYLRAVDKIEAEIIAPGPRAVLPVKHIFTPGLYSREIFMPKGTLVTSKIHKTEHPYVISMGVVSVWTEMDGVINIAAPYSGITKPGTRRLIYVHEDCIWTTFHPTNHTDVDKIEEDIIEKHDNKLLVKPEELQWPG